MNIRGDRIFTRGLNRDGAKINQKGAYKVIIMSLSGTMNAPMLINQLDGREFHRLHSLTEHVKLISYLAVSSNFSNPYRPDNRCLLVSGDKSGGVQLWDA